MTLRLHNTLTRSRKDFVPIDPKAVRMYVCGPTVYDFAHIGNARPVIVFDVLFRLLRHLYGASHVIYTRNITDVDDKINARAARDFPALPLNEAIAKVTEATERQFHEDVAALGCLPPTHEPRATQYIEKMRAMIERLIASGVAYVAEDHVLFSPRAMNALNSGPRYGELAHRSLDEMLAGARVEVAPYKRDPMDFVLWKPSKPNEPGWPSPAGIAAPGRPGWHIECSAMSMATLLEPLGGGLECDDPSRNVFDIHGGGIDLVFPHHENEIAQSCSAFHSSKMANVWMHNGFLQVEGEKMAKSAGNFVTIRELLETGKFGNGTWSGDVLRLAMLRTHYRQPIDWTARELERAHAELGEWYGLISSEPGANEPPDPIFLEALYDDLNTHEALARVSELAKAKETAALRASLSFLGFTCELKKLSRKVFGTARSMSVASGRMAAVVTKSRSDGPADAVSGAMGQAENLGDVSVSIQGTGITVSSATPIVIRSNADGTYSTDPATEKWIDNLLERRKAARAAKNFSEADGIREELGAKGFAIKDNKDGTTSWEPKPYEPKR